MLCDCSPNKCIIFNILEHWDNEGMLVHLLPQFLHLMLQSLKTEHNSGQGNILY